MLDRSDDDDHQVAEDLNRIANHEERGDPSELLGSEFRACNLLPMSFTRTTKAVVVSCSLAAS